MLEIGCNEGHQKEEHVDIAKYRKELDLMPHIQQWEFWLIKEIPVHKVDVENQLIYMNSLPQHLNYSLFYLKFKLKLIYTSLIT